MALLMRPTPVICYNAGNMQDESLYQAISDHNAAFLHQTIMIADLPHRDLSARAPKMMTIINTTT
jgi:hypothetical protein